MMFHMLGPTIVARKMAKTSAGNASQASVTRMITWSTQRPTYPDRIPIAVPIPPATSVPISPTISDTRVPWMRRLRTSRLWKSVPSNVVVRPPSIQNGGRNPFAPFTGSVGSCGAMRSAKIATSIRPPRMTTGTSGASRAALMAAPSLLPARPRARAVRVAIVAIAHLPREPDSRVDEGVEDVHDQVDPDDHDAGHDHDALHEREDRDERVLERVHGDDHDVGEPLEPGELDVLAAQDLQHARAGQPEHRRGEVPPEGEGGHDDVPPVAGPGGRQPSEPDGEHEDQDEPEPKARDREAEQSNPFGDVVPRAVDLHRRDDARRNTDEQRDERGGETGSQR